MEKRRKWVSLLELAHEQVELRVGDLGFVELPVLLVVFDDRSLQLLDRHQLDLGEIQGHDETESRVESG